MQACENRDRIPHISHYSVYLYKVKCNNMVKYYQKDKQNFNVIDQAGVRHRRSLFFYFMFKYYPLIIFLTSAV